ncbi:unnamed protein product [Caenorhabditis auriculariae]|uniref:Peptidase C1A papain C-terminal domain-containing protein n=1 Tax=Caenorhabditis auriculariae TaxID=2777116 RepID=A0A8S1H011_9PELO|nr:unnamed protein product [Caenorhabditis auriculariae]
MGLQGNRVPYILAPPVGRKVAWSHSELVNAQLDQVRAEKQGQGPLVHAFNLINYTLQLRGAIVAGVTSIFHAFYHRYYVLARGLSTRSFQKLSLALSYAIPFATTMIQFTAAADFAAAKAQTQKFHPTYMLGDEFAVVGFTNIKTLFSTISALSLTFVLYGAPFFAIYFRRKILRILRTASQNSEKCKVGKSVLTGLTCQAVLPALCYMPGMSIYIYASFRGISMTPENSLMLEYFLGPIVLFPALVDPILTIYFVLPYRRRLVNFIVQFVIHTNFTAIEEETRKRHPEDNFDGFIFIGFLDANSVAAKASASGLALVLIGVPILSIIFRRKIIVILDENWEENEKTKQTKSVLMGLTIQAVMPTFCYIPGVLINLLSYMRSDDIKIMEFEYILPLLVTLSPLVDPLLTIYFVLPYRNRITNFVFEFITPADFAVIGEETKRLHPKYIYNGFTIVGFLDTKSVLAIMSGYLPTGVLIGGLTIQAVMPTFCYIPSTTIKFLAHLRYDVKTVEMEYFLPVLTSLSPLVDPLLTIYFVLPYRLRKMFVLLLAFTSLTAAMVVPVVVKDVPHGIHGKKSPVDLEQLTGQELTDYLNAHQNYFKAELPKKPVEELKKKLMKLEFVKAHRPEDTKDIVIADNIPDAFDTRKAWPDCMSVTNIRDQTQCGSCWAFAAAEAISDRTCIASKGKINTLLSAEDVLSCCGEKQCGGCEGGWPIEAFNWWNTNGFCTGGSYISQFGCKPYSLPPCGETINNVTYPRCPDYGFDTPTCSEKCTTTSNYDIPYAKDKHFGKSAYQLPNKVAAIQTDIMQNGPVEAAFTVYEDFYQYKSGIYVHTAGKSIGGHAVKILGWGVEDGTPYWTIANSWSSDWGEHGYFRIVRGLDECGMEGSIVAGIPK